MKAIKCDLCDSELEMEAGGRTATCVFCGMRYSVERLQEKLCATQNFEGGINVGNIKISEDAEQLKTLLVKYLDSFDYNNALHIINRILEVAPTDAEANKIYDRLQELRYFEIKNKVLVKYSGNSKNIIIPDGVTEIAKSAFSYEQNDYGKSSRIETLVIPDSVTVIGDHAFENCNNLSKVQWSKNLTEIGVSAFSYTAISELILPERVTKISVACFAGCSNLKTIILHDSVSEIYDAAFWGSAIEDIVIPDSVTDIKERAFLSCSQLSQVHIGSNVKRIGSQAFSYTAISEITIPSSVTNIDCERRYNRGAFSCCKNLRIVNILSNKINYEEELVFSETPYIEKKQQRAQELRKKEEAELERRFQEQKMIAILKQKKDRCQKGVCQYCGGKFTGVFTKKCSDCGKLKDY